MQARSGADSATRTTGREDSKPGPTTGEAEEEEEEEEEEFFIYIFE